MMPLHYVRSGTIFVDSAHRTFRGAKLAGRALRATFMYFFGRRMQDTPDAPQFKFLRACLS